MQQLKYLLHKTAKFCGGVVVVALRVQRNVSVVRQNLKENYRKRN
jgi:hypothetical protein